MLIQYDVEQSITDGGLLVSRRIRYEQSSIPESVTLVPTEILTLLNLSSFEDVLLITDNQLKFKLIDVNSGNVLSTYLGPVFGGYVTQFKVC